MAEAESFREVWPPVYLLGAPDPEMALIERLLDQPGERRAYALSEGRRVHPASTYEADGSDPKLPAGTPVVLVECDGPVAEGLRVVARCDHHCHGDPGYGVPPEMFLEASAIGQVFRRLTRSDWGRCEYDYRPGAGGWGLAYRVSLCSCCPPREGFRLVPEEIVLAAAADHCLAAAYQGRCPGVHPDRLMRWRAETRAAHQRRRVREVLADIERARAALRAAPRTLIAGVEVADMRPGAGAACGAHRRRCPGDRDGCWGDVPELPEAAARDGVPFIASPKPAPVEVGQGRKVVVQAAPPEVVQAVLDGALDLDCVYGDPQRGFAGGYQRQRKEA